MQKHARQKVEDFVIPPGVNQGYAHALTLRIIE